MEDPTVFEGVFDNLIQQIEAGANNEEISNDLNKSILEARLKTSENPSYFVMTINMNGSASGSGGAQKRRDLLSIILRSAFPTALIFCQEIPGKFEKEVVPKKYRCEKKGNEAAVIWDSEHFDGSSEGLDTTNREIRNLRDKIKDKRDHASELLSRISMVKLTPLVQERDESILAVSFHGCYKKKEEDKTKAFLSLIEFLNEVIKLRGISSYIIGGDFNFDTLEVELPDKVVVPFPQSSARSLEKQQELGKYIPNKDNFIWYPHPAVIKVSWSRALEFCDKNDKSSDLTKEEHKTVHKSLTSETTKTTNTTASGATGTTEASEATKETKATDLLDHDPVVGVLVFLPPPKEVRQDLSKTFENMSMSDSQKGADAAYPGTE